MSNENDIVNAVDEIVDNLDPDDVEREARRLGISTDELLDRITVEIKARLA
jgi:uncharacterized protein YidB (DUF937 family)